MVDDNRYNLTYNFPAKIPFKVLKPPTPTPPKPSLTTIQDQIPCENE